MVSRLKTILIVDDDEDILKLVNKILTAAGFNVLMATSPSMGRDIIEKEAPHLILSDLHMEPEDGFQFIQSIRTQKQYSSIPMLVLSSLNDFNSVKKAIALGINDYSIKPLQPSMLIRKIKKALLNKDFVKWDVPAAEQVEFNIEVPATITALGETGYTLQGPFKLAEGKEIQVSSPELTELGLSTFPQRVSSMVKTYQSGGNFNNDVTFIGVNETASSKIRKFVTKKNAR